MPENQPQIAGVIAPPPLVYALPLAVSVFINRRKPRAFLPRRVARPLGIILLACAGMLEVWFLLTLRQARTSPNPYQPVARLVQHGPFRFSRNPSYLSFTLAYIGIASLSNSLWSLVLLPGTIAAAQYGIILREERYLAARFGAEYMRYKDRVRRWF